MVTSYELKQSAAKLYCLASKPIFAILPIGRPALYESDNALDNAIAQLKAMGSTRPLIVTDRVLAGLPPFGVLTKALKAHDIEPVIFDGVCPDPTFDVVDAGIAVFNQHACDGAIAFGGGSAIDACKVINICATHGWQPRNRTLMFSLWRAGSPFLAIPTTAGTGSEATIASVISDGDSHQKHPMISLSMVPDIAVLDGSLMTGLPPAITAATGIDALTHAIESYLSRFATSATDEQNERVVKAIFDNLPTAYSDGEQLPARQALAKASFEAGETFTRTSVGWVHAIAHQLGAHYGVPHGLANAIVLPHVLRFYGASITEKLADLAKAIGLQGNSADALANAFLDAIDQLLKKLDIEPIATMIKAVDIDMIAAAATKEVYLTPYPVPRYPDDNYELHQLINTISGKH